jgi:hypothetical protein
MLKNTPMTIGTTTSTTPAGEPIGPADTALFVRKGQTPLETVKHGDRVIAIRSRLRASAQITLKTSVCARNIRRDFNIASAKMYVFGLDRSFAWRLQNALNDMEWEASMLEADVAIYSHIPTDQLIPNVYSLDIVSAESAQMMRILRKADAYLAKLYAAQLLGFLEREKRHEVMKPFWMSYSAFKAVAMKIETKSLDQMMAEVHVG